MPQIIFVSRLGDCNLIANIQRKHVLEIFPKEFSVLVCLLKRKTFLGSTGVETFSHQFDPVTRPIFKRKTFSLRIQFKCLLVHHQGVFVEGLRVLIRFVTNDKHV